MQCPDRRLTALMVAVAVAVLAHQAPLASPPPAETFGRLPEVTKVRLSPSGDHCVALRMVRGAPYLAVLDVSGGPGQAIEFYELEVMKNFEEKIRSIHWLNDEMIGVVLEFEGNRFGTPTKETRLIAVSRDMSRGTTIPDPPRGALLNTQLAHRIIDFLPEDPDHVLMALDRKSRGSELSVYKVNVETGDATLVLYGDESVAGYLVDQQGRVRLRREITDDEVTIRICDVDRSTWRTLWEYNRSVGMEFYPLAFSENPNTLLVTRVGKSELEEIFEYQIGERALGERVFAHPEVDATGLEIDPYTREVLGANYAVHYPSVQYFDEELDEIQQTIDAALPDSFNDIANFDRSREKFIVFVTSPTLPGLYYLFTKETLELHPIGKTYEELDWDALRPVEPVTYEARDGMTIPSYLTQPVGKPPFPMVVLPHGGPTSRDFRRFDYVAQFLASRGYAILQPNFRGSTGYGASFLAAGRKQWGLAMQDDLEDGTRAMIDRGIADPERICIVGWSYGGYAALMGAAKSPDLFSCAVAGAAVTDIPRMLKEDSRYKFASRNRPSVGHYRRDRDNLRDNSPINNADIIQIPILLVHGDNDRVVPYQHSKRMAAKLKKEKTPYVFISLEDGDHHLSLEQNRVRFLKELESFLAEHIPVGP